VQFFFLVLRAYARLIHFDLYLLRGNSFALTRKVFEYPVNPSPPSNAPSVAELCYAMDMASIWYYRTILCLQRSAATTCFLRSFGVKAEMIRGSQQLPFKSHAWVEVAGKVVSDKPYMRELWAVIGPARTTGEGQ